MEGFIKQFIIVLVLKEISKEFMNNSLDFHKKIFLIIVKGILGEILDRIPGIISKIF